MHASRVWRSAWRPTSSTWLRRNPLGRRFFSHLAKSAKRFCALKDVKDSVCKWYPSLEVEVPAALLLHVTRYSIFSNSSIILPRLRASIGVTRSYSSRPFLCTLGVYHRGVRVEKGGREDGGRGRQQTSCISCWSLLFCTSSVLRESCSFSFLSISCETET